MKIIITTIAATLFTASVGAADFYQGIDQGNSDLSTPRVSAQDFAGVQPGIGDSVDRYQDWDEGNPDLFKASSTGSTDGGNDPDIYMGLSENPDLHF